MRPIKFRCWHGMHGMVYGCVQWHPAARAEWLLPLEGGNLVTVDAIPMQYTGLKDKSGQEIYEGDVVESRINGMGTGSEYPVIWDCDYLTYTVGAAMLSGMDVEVVGNIYANPELVAP